MKLSLILLYNLLIVVPSWCNSRDNETPILPETGESETNPRQHSESLNNNSRPGAVSGSNPSGQWDTSGMNPVNPQGENLDGTHGHQVPPYQLHRVRNTSSSIPSVENPGAHLTLEGREPEAREPEHPHVSSNNSAPQFLHPGHPGLILTDRLTPGNMVTNLPQLSITTSASVSFSRTFSSSLGRVLTTSPRDVRRISSAKPPTQAGEIIMPEQQLGTRPETSSPSLITDTSSLNSTGQTRIPSTNSSTHLQTSSPPDRRTTPTPQNINDSVSLINPTKASIYHMTTMTENQIAEFDPLRRTVYVPERESSSSSSVITTLVGDLYSSSRIPESFSRAFEILNTLQVTPSRNTPTVTKPLGNDFKTIVVHESGSLGDSFVTSFTPLLSESSLSASTAPLSSVGFDHSRFSFSASYASSELTSLTTTLSAAVSRTEFVATSVLQAISTTEQSISVYFTAISTTDIPEVDVNDTSIDSNSTLPEAQASVSSNWTVETEAANISETSNHFVVNGSDLNSNDTDSATVMTLTKTTLFTHLITSLLPNGSKPTVKPSTSAAVNQTKNTRKVTIAPTPTQGQTVGSTTIVPPGTSPPAAPTLYIRLGLQMTWREFCASQHHFRREVMKIVEIKVGQVITMEQIILFDTDMTPCQNSNVISEDIMVRLYLSDRDGHFNAVLTEQCGLVIEQGFQAISDSPFKDKLKEVQLVGERPKKRPKDESVETGITVAIVIASVGGLCCVVLILLQVLLHRRHGRKMRTYIPGLRQYSVRSTDSIALSSVTKSRPHSGYFNPGMDTDDKVVHSHPVNFAGLGNFSADVEPLYEQFQLLPEYVPSLSDVPAGSEDKNRYVNVIPFPETRVYLSTRPEEDASDYINASYITGYKEDYRAYIATQAPVEHTIADFWKMVWEQQTRVIIMLTPLQEHGLSKCAEYWPDTEGVDTMRLYGDYRVELMKENIKPEYIVSTFILKYLEKNLTREVKHFWFTNWPQHNNPDPVTLVKFIRTVRPHYEDSSAPVIVHCSPGTGRTGSLIATDICMRMYEDTETVDILNCVCKMRLERAGMVQTREQYALIYKALNEYAIMLNSPPPSKASSTISLQTL